MNLLNKHIWKPVAYHFKTWRCSRCGAERFWNMETERMMFVKHGKSSYLAPECNHVMHGDPIYKEI